MSSDFECYLCAGREGRRVADTDAKTREPLRVMQCTGCGLVQQYPLPESRELHVYYSHHYRLDYKRVHKPRPKHVHRAGVAALDRVGFLAREGIRSGRLTDVGAGGGEFVFVASQCGFDASGVEPNLGYSAFARDAYDVEVSTAEVGSLEPGSADVVTMFHVLEHIADPRAALRSIWSALAPGGHLFIEVPNILAADASPHNIYFKAHLFYFSAPTLAAVADACFERVAVQDHGNLLMLLRRRDAPLEPRLPEASEVARALRRLDEKGWTEYLMRGQGWRKPIARWQRHRVEARFEEVPPRQILSELIGERNGP
jgi:2-polyprenyl-3-methyl-5-hydroxy-6-metoxy-1,4-benzoquinol methylase